MSAPSIIPPITHRYGKVWTQPDRSEVEIDDTHALMSAEAAAKLARYDTSYPSGVYPGKMWRRYGWLCWFDDSPTPDSCSIHSRRILISDGGEL